MGNGRAKIGRLRNFKAKVLKEIGGLRPRDLQLKLRQPAVVRLEIMYLEINLQSRSHRELQLWLQISNLQILWKQTTYNDCG